MSTFLNFKSRIFVALATSLWVFPTSAQTDTTPINIPTYTLIENASITFNLTYQFPYVYNVAEKFVEEYGYNSYEAHYIEFEKRPEGYFVTRKDHDTYPKLASRELFWSAKDGEWKPLTLNKTLPSPGTVDQLIHDEYYYNRVPYYGYNGWYRDVINEWEGKTNLSDVLQFSLATSWYQRATALLSDQYSIADSVETFILPDSKNALSPEQLEVYLKYMNRALEHYETLVRQAPDYETIVGPATVKLADMYMTAFMQLHYFQNEKTALKIIDRPPLTFNAFLLESARNLLRSCPKNAILLTWGDNDTYPLWYVQAKQGFRRDVVVANLSLISTGRYINHLRDSIFDAPPLKFQIPQEFYFNGSSVQVFLGKNAAIPVPDFFSALVSKTKIQFQRSGNPYCASNGVYFYTDQSGKIIPVDGKPPRKSNRVELMFDQKNYLIRDQLAVLDLLYSNTPNRPLCFASSCRDEAMEPYKKHMRLRGLVYCFDPKQKEPVDGGIFGAVDAKKSYHLFMEELEYNSRGPISFDGDTYIGLNRVNALVTARELSKQGQKKKAEHLLDKIEQVFPNSRVTYDGNHLYLADTYDQIGKKEKSLAIVRQVLDNYEAGKVDWLASDSRSIETMKRLAQKHKDLMLMERLERL